MSAIDAETCSSLNLETRGLKWVLGPTNREPELKPTFSCALAFEAHTRVTARGFEWPDIIEVFTFDLPARPFNAVIGMDLLGKGILTVTRVEAVQFDF